MRKIIASVFKKSMAKAAFCGAIKAKAAPCDPIF